MQSISFFLTRHLRLCELFIGVISVIGIFIIFTIICDDCIRKD